MLPDEPVGLVGYREPGAAVAEADPDGAGRIVERGSGCARKRAAEPQGQQWRKAVFHDKVLLPRFMLSLSQSASASHRERVRHPFHRDLVS